MTPITVSLEIPRYIIAGLLSGTYERVGGVIRAVDTKQVVLWLRETSPAAVGPLSTLSPALAVLGSAASMISLGVSVAGFAMLSERLGQLDARLSQVQQAVERLGRRINMLYDAQIRAAFTMADTAFCLSQPTNRRASALLAIDRLVVAQHQLAALTDEHLQQATQTSDEYLLLLMLAHLYEVRCLLELEELEHAQTRLRAGVAAVRPLTERYVQQLLTPNPAVYLQPALAQQISLERLSRIYRWLSPDNSPTTLFELLRSRIFELQPANDAWIRTLPTSIWDPALQTGNAGSGTWWPWAKDVANEYYEWMRGLPSGQRGQALLCLAQAIGDMESMVESYQHLAGYQDEVQVIRDTGLTFQQWCGLLPETPQLEASVVYLQRTERVPLRVDQARS